MLPKPLLEQLIREQRITEIPLDKAELFTQQEHASLKRLQAKPAGYLNSYDQIFRHISILLINQGYALTQFQPHQVFKLVLKYIQPGLPIDAIIQERHRVKKEMIAEADLELTHLLLKVKSKFEAKL